MVQFLVIVFLFIPSVDFLCSGSLDGDDGFAWMSFMSSAVA